MKKYIYSCDGGCIKIGNEQFNVHLPNGYGDGFHRIYVGTEKEIENLRPKDSEFIGSIEGKFNVYEYDCGNEILFELEGCYAIFKYKGTIYFERWE